MKTKEMYPSNPVFTKPEFFKINPKKLSKLTYRYGELIRQKGYVICGDTMYVYHRNLLAAKAKYDASKLKTKFYLPWLKREATQLKEAISNVIAHRKSNDEHLGTNGLTEEELESLYR